jgi:hypothetical protein
VVPETRDGKTCTHAANNLGDRRFEFDERVADEVIILLRPRMKRPLERKQNKRQEFRRKNGEQQDSPSRTAAISECTFFLFCVASMYFPPNSYLFFSKNYSFFASARPPACKTESTAYQINSFSLSFRCRPAIIISLQHMFQKGITTMRRKGDTSESILQILLCSQLRHSIASKPPVLRCSHLLDTMLGFVCT